MPVWSELQLLFQNMAAVWAVEQPADLTVHSPSRGPPSWAGRCLGRVITCLSPVVPSSLHGSVCITTTPPREASLLLCRRDADHITSRTQRCMVSRDGSFRDLLPSETTFVHVLMLYLLGCFDIIFLKH